MPGFSRRCGTYATLASAVFLLLGSAFAQSPPIDPALAQQYFAEALAACEKDAGKLWGKSLCGPMLFVERGSRAVAANQADQEGRLTRQGAVFVGRLPDDQNIANTATTWAGVKWTMIIWPLSSSPAGRTRLMAHELFHRVQDELGLPAANPANAHLDSREGRIWLQLELRALRQALARPSAPREERRRAIEDALRFRAMRRSLFPQAAADERALEMNEGLAEYTGVKLRGPSDPAAIEYTLSRIGNAEDQPSFVRSFAYQTGPAYGLLLDLLGVEWRKGLTAEKELSGLLQEALAFRMPDAVGAEAERRALDYDGEALRFVETLRDAERQKRVARYRARLVEGPVLVLPVLEKFQYSYDPSSLVPLDDSRTAYPELRVTDAWGILEVSDGALLVREGGQVVRVVLQAPTGAGPAGGAIEGNGWKLRPAPGWTLAPGERKGDFRLVKGE